MSPSGSESSARHAGEEAIDESFLAPLRSVLSWIRTQEKEDGRVLCSEHHVEHTGKSACALILALELRKHDPSADRADLLSFAIRQARRLAVNLKREGTSPCHTFRPGRHDPFNCSNSVIDGGACCDALSSLLIEAGDELAPEDREKFGYACELHARTYLRYAVVDKGIPAQRAWGLTGLAGALTLNPTDEPMQLAAAQAIEELRQIQHEDGSYPYHPKAWGGSHPGAGDVSAYYQSRVTGFLLHSMERLGLDPRNEELRGPLLDGVRFLTALQGPDGVKVGLLEAKPWYWGATYEVASHPFDIFTLARAHVVFSGGHDPDRKTSGAARGALRAFSAWADHLTPAGEPRSHKPGRGRGRSYQCPMFWASHAAWIARALPDLAECARAEARAKATQPSVPAAERALDLSVSLFPGAQLARLEDGHVVAWVRGGRPGSTFTTGARMARDSCAACANPMGPISSDAVVSGESSRESGRGGAGTTSLRRGWNSGKRELRFSWWLARVHARAGRWMDALLQPARTFRRGIAAFAHPRISSAFDLQPRVQLLPDGVCLGVRAAHRDGSSPAQTSEIERVFRVDGEGLEVLERTRAGDLRYQIPSGATEVEQREGEGGQEIRYRLS